MKKIKGILLFTTLLVLLVGVVSATELSDNTIATNEVTQQAVQDTSSVSYDTGTKNTVNTDVVNDKSIAAEDIQENTTLEDNKIVKNELKNVKKASQHTYDVNNFNSLNDAICNSDYDDVTINIESNIQLEKLIVITDDTNKTLIINGNSHTINGSGEYQFLWIGSKWNVTINNLNFTNCHSNGHGGVIDNFGANITINNCNFTNNNAEYGGAINNQLNCTIVFNSCKFENNEATGDHSDMGGGAIFNEDSTIILDNCTLIGNQALVHGGAIYNKGTAIITNSMINKNSAEKSIGGAIYNSGGDLTIINSTINDNDANIGGGAIYAIRGTVIINNTTLKSNKIYYNDGDGGAIKHERGTMLIYNSIFENNNAPFGAALYNYRGTTSIYNSEFNNNEGTHGGAISNGRTLTLSNSTFNNNKATYGGAIRNNGNLILSNSTFNKNSGTYGGVLYNNDSTSNITNTLFNNNKATYGGAIHNNGNLILSNSTFNKNSGEIYGGAFYNNATSNIINTIFYSNDAMSGGAICSEHGILYLYDSILKNNTAAYASGGAITNIDKAEIYRNKFITNQARYEGKAILYDGDSVKVEDNINAGDSKYGATILSMGDNVDICYNGFYQEPFYTNLIISTNNSNPKINDKINITCRLEDQFNIAIPDQEVKIIINDNTEINELTNADGIVSYEYTLTNKNEKIIALYDGDEDYHGETATLDITVPTDTQILVDEVSAVVGQECRISGTLLDTSGTPLMQETLYMTLDNHTYLLSTNEAGQFETTTAFFKTGKYDMLITFNGNNDYSPSNKTQTIPVLSQASIDIEILNNTQSNVQIEIIVTDETKTGIPAQEVIITLPNGTTTTQKTDTNGKIRITNTTATVGEKTVTAKIESTEELMGTTESKNITIVPDFQKIIENLINLMKEQNKTINNLNNTVNELNDTVKKQEKTIAEQNNTINNLNNTVNELNDTVKKQNKTITEQNKTINDLNNTVNELNDTVKKQEKTITEQNNTINDLNNQNKKLNNTVNTLTTQLKDANKKITELNNTVKDLNNKLDTANKEIKTLKNTNNKLNKQVTTLNNTVKNLTAQLKNANKKITTLTNKNKNLTQQLKDANKKIKTLNNTNKKLTQQLKDANKKIADLEAQIRKLLNPTKYNTTIKINQIKSTVGSTVKITAKIQDQNGAKVNDGRVIFKINGKTLKDEYNNTIYAIVSNGTASINYKVQNVWLKNTTTIEAVYSGSNKYNQTRTKTDKVLKISKGISNVTLEKQTITAKAGQTVTFRAKILDSSGDRVNSDKVVYKLNGKTLTDKNGNAIQVKVVDGEATLDYTIPTTYTAKKHNLTAVFGGGNYERTQTNGSLILKKKGTTINTNSITTKNGKTTIKGTIRDETGALLVTSTKLAIKVNGKTVLNNVTSTNGKIDVSFITTLKPGMYELLIISGENGIYKKSTMTTVLNI